MLGTGIGSYRTRYFRTKSGKNFSMCDYRRQTKVNWYVETKLKMLTASMKLYLFFSKSMVQTITGVELVFSLRCEHRSENRIGIVDDND